LRHISKRRRVMIRWVENREHLAKLREEHGDFLVLVSYGSFSSAAQRALKELEAFSDEHSKMPVYVIDVQKVKGVHKSSAWKTCLR